MTGADDRPDRARLLADLGFHTSQVSRVLEELAAVEPSGRLVQTWQQMAAVTRRMRGIARHHADEHRRALKRKDAA